MRGLLLLLLEALRSRKRTFIAIAAAHHFHEAVWGSGGEGERRAVKLGGGGRNRSGEAVPHDKLHLKVWVIIYNFYDFRSSASLRYCCSWWWWGWRSPARRFCGWSGRGSTR